MIEISFDCSELLSALARAADGIKPRQREAMQRSGKRLVADMRGRLTRQGKRSSDRLYKAVDYRIVEAGDSMTVEVGPRIGNPKVEPYDVVVDQGRGAGKPPPPKGALLEDDWLQKHGLPERAEYPIRMKIGREGIAPAPYIDITGDRTAAVLREADEVLTFVRHQFGS
jgi:hypothetical protein